MRLVCKYRIVCLWCQQIKHWTHAKIITSLVWNNNVYVKKELRVHYSGPTGIIWVLNVGSHVGAIFQLLARIYLKSIIIFAPTVSFNKMTKNESTTANHITASVFKTKHIRNEIQYDKRLTVVRSTGNKAKLRVFTWRTITFMRFLCSHSKFCECFFGWSKILNDRKPIHHMSYTSVSQLVYYS